MRPMLLQNGPYLFTCGPQISHEPRAKHQAVASLQRCAVQQRQRATLHSWAEASGNGKGTQGMLLQQLRTPVDAHAVPYGERSACNASSALYHARVLMLSETFLDVIVNNVQLHAIQLWLSFWGCTLSHAHGCAYAD